MSADNYFECESSSKALKEPCLAIGHFANQFVQADDGGLFDWNSFLNAVKEHPNPPVIETSDETTINHENGTDSVVVNKTIDFIRTIFEAKPTENKIRVKLETTFDSPRKTQLNSFANFFKTTKKENTNSLYGIVFAFPSGLDGCFVAAVITIVIKVDVESGTSFWGLFSTKDVSNYSAHIQGVKLLVDEQFKYVNKKRAQPKN